MLPRDAAAVVGGDHGLWSSYRFDPNTLDDPDMLQVRLLSSILTWTNFNIVEQGKHRYVLRGGDMTAPVMSSVILFVNAKDLKDVSILE
jgi:hypothetical protein